MKIVLARLYPYCLPLRQPWRSARGVTTARRGWLVRLESDCGLTGYGDCAPLTEAGTETASAALARLQAALPALVGGEVESWLARLDYSWMTTPAARCAIETALVDLLAQHAGVPLARWLNPSAGLAPQVNAVIGALGEGVVERLGVAQQQGYSIFKVKVGVGDPDAELLALQRLPAVGKFRLDANGAWDEATALRFIEGVTNLPVESLEEPLAHPDPAGLRRLQAAAGFPLALDESLARADDRDACIAGCPVRRLVLKPAVLGGPLAAYSLACRARSAHLECVATTTLDCAVGTWAAAHLAAALDNDIAHGLSTAAWLADDVGNLPHLAADRVRLDNAVPGLGFLPFAELF